MCFYIIGIDYERDYFLKSKKNFDFVKNNKV